MSYSFDFSRLRKRNYSGITITNSSTQSLFSSQSSSQARTVFSSQDSFIDVKKALYQCGKCDKVIGTLAGFRNHLRRTHGEEKIFKCDKCGLAYKHQSGLCQHIRNFHTDPDLECTKCLKAFNSRGNLKRHLQTHVESVEELDDIWKQNYVHTERQAKALERSQKFNELQNSSSSGTDDSQPLHAPLTYKASDIFELRNPKMPRFNHLRLGSTIFPHFKRFNEGRRFPLSSVEGKDCSSFTTFSCSSCKTSNNLSRLGLENHYILEHPTVMESGKYCEICMKLVDNMAAHLRIHQLALTELQRFPLLLEPLTSL